MYRPNEVPLLLGHTRAYFTAPLPAEIRHLDGSAPPVDLADVALRVNREAPLGQYDVVLRSCSETAAPGYALIVFMCSTRRNDIRFLVGHLRGYVDSSLPSYTVHPAYLTDGEIRVSRDALRDRYAVVLREVALLSGLSEGYVDAVLQEVRRRISD